MMRRPGNFAEKAATGAVNDERIKRDKPALKRSLFVRLKGGIGLKFIRDPIHSGISLQLLMVR
jgi:hypothetical protein